MGIFDKATEKILSWISPIGLVIILLIIVCVWCYYYFVEKNPLNYEEIIGLILLAFVIVALGQLIFKLFRKKRKK
jgi:uncharacterized membrane protein (DUF373 family)